MNITGSIGTEQDPQEQRRIHQQEESRISIIRATTGALKDPQKQSRIDMNRLSIVRKRSDQQIAKHYP